MCYNGKRSPLMLLLLVQVCLNSSNETRPSLLVSIAVNMDLTILRAALPDPRLMSRSVGLTRSMFTAIDTNRDGLVSLEEFRHTCAYNNNIRGLLFPL